MNSMQEALTTALEHPIEERPKGQAVQKRRAPETQSGGILWAAVGSVLSLAAFAWYFRRHGSI